MKILVFLLFIAQSALASDKYQSAFERVWSEAKKQVYPESLVKKYFKLEKKKELESKIDQVTDWSQFDAVMNPFLLDLGVSHTYFYSVEDPDYYFLRSLFTTKELETPKIFHAGMQFKKISGRFVIRNVLEGYPADQAGLERGDVILSASKRVFHPLKTFADGKKKEVSFLRNGKIRTVSLRPVYESLHYSFVQASRQSTKIIKIDNTKIGYFHLWTGTHLESLQALKEAVEKFKDTDGFILDLRDGFGGAWWDHLDPFFPSRNSYFVATVKNRTKTETRLEPPQQDNKNHYSKPLVILSNEGVRSGKEALVYQFKKTRRGFVIGNTTGGMFSMGKGVFSEDGFEYILYLSVAELFLDGQKVEGIGIQPDLVVDYTITENFESDPQLSAAIVKLKEQLRL